MARETEAERFAEVRVVIFDLDGTLIDSKLDLAHSVNATLVESGRNEISHEKIFGYVGEGAATLIRRALGDGAGDAEAERALAFFLSYYRAHMLDNTVLYPGVREGLEQLAKHSLAVLTNKPVRFSRAILEGLRIADYFQFIYGGNSFERKKPDPAGVQVLLNDFGAAPREAMFVGDSDVDVRTARNAGTWSCGVTYGLGTEGMKDCPPDMMIDSLTELPLVLNGV